MDSVEWPWKDTGSDVGACSLAELEAALKTIGACVMRMPPQWWKAQPTPEEAFLLDAVKAAARAAKRADHG